jgi:hypothetical protein
MATRYYLPSSGSAPVTPALQGGWGSDQHVGSKNLVKTKSNTALTDFTTSSATGNICMFQYVSAPIGSVVFAGTNVSMVVRGLKTGAGTCTFTIAIFLFHSNNTFTTLLARTIEDSAFGTSAATRIANAVTLANVLSTNGDRIVVELGVGITSASTTTLRTGDPSATGDFALTSGLTTDLDPWVEFSAAIPAAGSLISFFH